MSGHVSASVDRYLELSGKPRGSLLPVATRCIDDHQLDPADDVNKGELKQSCAKIVLKTLYVARMNRTDLLWAVNSLAREVTRWSVNWRQKTPQARLLRALLSGHADGVLGWR